jgi:hypothetical protein
MSMKKLVLLSFISMVFLQGCTTVTETKKPIRTYTNSNVLPFLIPKDVMDDFQKTTLEQRSPFCKCDPNLFCYPPTIEQYIPEKPPLKIKGYNSRMDNRKDVQGAEELGMFVLRFSEFSTSAFASQDEKRMDRSLNALYHWAKAGALKKTRKCFINGNGVCPESWRRADGQDLAPSMDHNTVQMSVMFLEIAYYILLKDYKPNEHRHVVIQSWFDYFKKYNKRPKRVYFGLGVGWYWPTILKHTQNGDISCTFSDCAKRLAKNLLNGIDPLIHSDGSIEKRTTRGNRALWYHASALHEILISLEIIRALDIAVPANLDERIKKAGDIFIKGLMDHSYMDKWASKAHNSIYKPGDQIFQKNIDTLPNLGSWFHIFMYRYPNSELTKKLKTDYLSHNTVTSRKDGMIGLGLGCIYNSARLVNSNNKAN